MRKNWARKLLHGTLDLLPLIIIPIFAINIINRSPEPISLEIQEKQLIDFNQRVVNGYVDDISKWGASVNIDIDNDLPPLIYAYANDSGFLFTHLNCTLQSEHKYLVKYDFTSSANVTLHVGEYSSDSANTFVDWNYAQHNNYYLFTYTGESRMANAIGIHMQQDFEIEVRYVQFFDLTQMYGVGNEPTVNDFNNSFPNDYYSYTLSENMLIDKPNVTVYADTDIGSQFVYSLYHAVDKYFNMGDVFHMQGVYDWFNVNIFGGTAPLSIYIVWNIVLYEFIMDLLMLLYSIFMFFIDFCTGLIERCLHKTSGGSL